MMITYLILFYIAGFAISAIKSFYSYCGLSLITRKANPDFFKKRPDIIVYMILKPIFWPYYFITEKSPLERISECFFSRYGEEGTRYFGDRGIKNFLNDIFRGKERYKNYIIKSVIWSVDKDSETYHDVLKFNKNFQGNLNARIHYARHHNKYLLDVALSEQSFEALKEISRFDLDQSQRLNEADFKDRLLNINKENTKILLDELKIAS